MATLLQSTNSFTVHTEKNFDDVLSDGTKVQYAGASDISVRRPNGIYVDYGDDISAKEFWYDGETFTLMDNVHNVYTSAPAAPTIVEAIDQLQSDYEVYLPFASLLRANSSGAYTEGVQSRRYLGLHDVDGQRCHHILFQGDVVDWQLWIDEGDQPLLRKVVVTYKTLPGSPQDVVVVTDWNLNPRLSDRVFEADIPDEAVRAEIIEVRRLAQ
jgi:hypothetical protein